MAPSKNKPSPREVFTPRSHDLNQRTYADRPALEKRMSRALSGHKYLILHGESGNGKTWLYKSVLLREGLPYQVINLAKMHTVKSLNAVLEAKAGDLKVEEPIGQKEETDFGVRPMGVGAGKKKILEYRMYEQTGLEVLAREMHRSAEGGNSVLVLDNFEQIIENDDFVREVASLIISADDEFVSQNKIKIMIVGTPSNIRDMISKVSNANTISNRVVEIPEVARLELGEARHIMSKGFEDHLNYTILLEKNELFKSIAHKADRIAQHVQELCLKIAQNAEDNNGIINASVVRNAEKEWIEETLSADSAVVETHMNSQKTTHGRKNQVLYCLGRIDTEDFNSHDVEEEIRRVFKVPDNLNLNIPQILAKFAKTDPPLIRRVKFRGAGYRFCSPKSRLVIRTKLYLDSNNQVIIPK